MSQRIADIRQYDSILPAPTIITRMGRLAIVTSSHQQAEGRSNNGCRIIGGELSTPEQTLQTRGNE